MSCSYEDFLDVLHVRANHVIKIADQFVSDGLVGDDLQKAVDKLVRDEAKGLGKLENSTLFGRQFVCLNRFELDSFVNAAEAAVDEGLRGDDFRRKMFWLLAKARKKAQEEDIDSMATYVLDVIADMEHERWAVGTTTEGMRLIHVGGQN